MLRRATAAATRVRHRARDRRPASGGTASSRSRPAKARARTRAEKGYTLVHTESAGVNAFFVRDDLAGALPSSEAVPRRSANQALMGLDHPAPRHAPDCVSTSPASTIASSEKPGSSQSQSSPACSATWRARRGRPAARRGPPRRRRRTAARAGAKPTIPSSAERLQVQAVRVAHRLRGTAARAASGLEAAAADARQRVVAERAHGDPPVGVAVALHGREPAGLADGVSLPRSTCATSTRWRPAPSATAPAASGRARGSRRPRLAGAELGEGGRGGEQREHEDHRRALPRAALAVAGPGAARPRARPRAAGGDQRDGAQLRAGWAGARAAPRQPATRAPSAPRENVRYSARPEHGPSGRGGGAQPRLALARPGEPRGEHHPTARARPWRSSR